MASTTNPRTDWFDKCRFCADDRMPSPTQATTLMRHILLSSALVLAAGLTHAVSPDHSAACSQLAARYANLYPTLLVSVSWGPCPEFRSQGLVRAERILQVYASANDLPEVAPGPHMDLIEDLSRAANQSASKDGSGASETLAKYSNQMFAGRFAARFRAEQLHWALAYRLLSIREAMEQGDLNNARIMTRDLLAEFDSLKPDWDYEALKRSKPELVTLHEILSGNSRPSATLDLTPPSQPWTFHNDHIVACMGDGHHRSHPLEREIPNVAEAWLAMGERELALREFLRLNWLDSATMLSLPLGFRDVVETLYGPSQANAEFAAALNTITINDTAFGKSASITLFGYQLPLPIGEYDESLAEAQTHYDGPVHALDPKRLSLHSIAVIQRKLLASWDRQSLQTRIAAFEKFVADCNHKVKTPGEVIYYGDPSIPESERDPSLITYMSPSWERGGCPILEPEPDSGSSDTTAIVSEATTTIQH